MTPIKWVLIAFGTILVIAIIALVVNNSKKYIQYTSDSGCIAVKSCSGSGCFASKAECVSAHPTRWKCDGSQCVEINGDCSDCSIGSCSENNCNKYYCDAKSATAIGPTKCPVGKSCKTSPFVCTPLHYCSTNGCIVRYDEKCPAGSKCFPGDCVGVNCAAQTLSYFEQFKSMSKSFDDGFMLIVTPTFKTQSSNIYRMNDFLAAVEIAQDQFSFSIENDTNGLITVIDLLLFLSQGIAETIIYDACDENNWSKPEYSVTAACGQGGQNYTSGAYQCEGGCPVDKDMELVATTHAKWWGAPAPLFCTPKNVYTKRWNIQSGSCMPLKYPPLLSQDEYISCGIHGSGSAECKDKCALYYEQKAGEFEGNDDDPKPSLAGCCWWGRGVIQLTGPCNIGRLNTALKQVQYLQNNDDLCKNPELMCSEKYPNLKWLAGLIYWRDNIHNNTNYEYRTVLNDFVKHWPDSIDAQVWSPGNSYEHIAYSISGIVNRGCATPGNGCDNFSLETEKLRMEFFKQLANAFFQLSSGSSSISTSTLKAFETAIVARANS